MSTDTTTDTAPVTDTFNIILQKGLENGPTPPLGRYIITRATYSQNFILSYKERRDDDGVPHLEYVIVSRSLKVAQHRESISRLQKVLGEIPTQYPGAEDLYGRSTSIVHVTDPYKLQDLEISGPSAGIGIPRPTEEQKALFDEAVAIVEKWGARTYV